MLGYISLLHLFVKSCNKKSQGERYIFLIPSINMPLSYSILSYIAVLNKTRWNVFFCNVPIINFLVLHRY